MNANRYLCSSLFCIIALFLLPETKAGPVRTASKATVTVVQSSPRLDYQTIPAPVAKAESHKTNSTKDENGNSSSLLNNETEPNPTRVPCGKCPNRTSMHFSGMVDFCRRKFDYGVEVKVLKKDVKRHGYSVKVLRIFKEHQKSYKIGQVVFAHVDSPCLCPKMKKGYHFIILGHSKANETSITLTNKTVIIHLSKKPNAKRTTKQLISRMFMTKCHHSQSESTKKSRSSVVVRPPPSLGLPSWVLSRPSVHKDVALHLFKYP